MEVTAEIAAEIATEIATEILVEAVGRTELKPNCSSGDP